MRVMLKHARAGRVPEPLATRPELRADLSRVWQGWWQLSAERREGMNGPLRIALGEMAAQLDVEAVTDAEARADWCDFWRQMDTAFIEFVRERREARSSAHAVPGTER